MHNHMCDCTRPSAELHTNAFIDINGFPYLIADYLDRRQFKQIDRSMIKSSIEVDQSESMRAIFDINVDDIGKRADGSLGIIGNNTKQVNLVEMINRNFSRLQNRLDVLRKGIVVRINYRVENHRTGQTIKTMNESFRISMPNYFLDVNPKNVNDNGIIANYSGSSVSSINTFTHGTDKMIFRITNIELFYECVKNGPCRPVGKEMYVGQPMKLMYDTFGDEFCMHQYQQNIAGQSDPFFYGNEPVENICPPSWLMFNHFYHFDNNGKDIIIHNDEVYDRNVQTHLIPCGTVFVNRAIVINPCQRIIFKFCVWKNDTTVVNDSTMIASALRASVRDPYYDGPSQIYPSDEIIDCRPGHNHGHDHYPDMEALMRMIHSGKEMDYNQNAAINQMNELLVELKNTLAELKGEGNEGEDTPTIPTLPEAPTDKPCKPPHHHHDPMEKIFCMIKSLQDQINEIKGDKPEDPDNPPSGDGCNCGDKYKPMQPEDIKDAVNDAMDETDPDKNGEDGI